MAQAIEDLRRTVAALTTTVSSVSVRYRLREIYERLAEQADPGPAVASRGPHTLTPSADTHLG